MRVNKDKLKIAVLCGGFEPERYASEQTGENIYSALKNAGYTSVFKLIVDSSIAEKLIKNKPDFAFLTMFCKWGEDGVLQGLLEILGIPYSGSGVETSAICKNKYFFNRFVRGVGLNSPKVYFYGHKKDFEKFNENNIVYPCIVKAVYQGYSLGTSLVKNSTNLKKSVSKAFKFSTKVAIEEFIDGKEFTVGVVDISNRESVVLPIIEIRFKNGHVIQSSEVKDKPELMDEIIPAKLSKSNENVLAEQSIYLYKKLGCLGVARLDVRRDRKGKFYFLENNTCPGIINYKHSNLPKQLKAAKITLEEFVEYMIVAGLNRPETKLEYCI